MVVSAKYSTISGGESGRTALDMEIGNHRVSENNDGEEGESRRKRLAIETKGNRVRCDEASLQLGQRIHLTLFLHTDQIINKRDDRRSHTAEAIFVIPDS